MKAIKGFDKDLKCRDFQFEIGQTYTHTGPVVACESGFHAIPEDVHPLTVFDYYAPAGSRFCEVAVSGETDSESDKVAAEVLTVEREINLADLTNMAVSWVTDRAKPEGGVARSDNGAATASGDQGAATASGDQGAATASGTQGAATASGYQGAATASGYQGAAMATGPFGRVRGDADNVDLFAREFVWRDGEYHRLSIACGTTGVDGIKAGVWYVCRNGKLVEAG